MKGELSCGTRATTTFIASSDTFTVDGDGSPTSTTTTNDDVSAEGREAASITSNVSLILLIILHRCNPSHMLGCTVAKDNGEELQLL